jgi:HD-GYP domain-containing protein (c-di-GMP phosphodiesterase class II)
MLKDRSLRALMIEDSEDDVLLMIRELKRNGYNPVYERIETAGAMKNALEDKQWDIILCDYNMPKFNAPSALALLKEANIDIPVIIVSGTIGEETAVACMHSGAQDYIMKGNLSRLGPAIARELEETKIRIKEKRVEESLRKSEERFKMQYHGSPIPTFTWQKTGEDFVLLECNDAARTVIGENAEKFINKTAQEMYHDKQGVLRDIHRCFEEKAVIKRELQSKNFMPGRHIVTTYAFVPDDLVMVHVEDITERVHAEAKLKDALLSLRRAFGTTIQVLASALEYRDPYTAGHQFRTTNLACAIASEMGLPQDTIEGISMAGSIHDIGKLSIPAEILVKPTKLTNLEFSLIMEHPQSGYDMLKNVESPWPLAQIVYQHHERMNGSGYPNSLKGDEIIMEARILAVADVVEAMASHRPYRAALGVEAALDEIKKNRGILYDATVADTCVRLFHEKGYRLL